MSKVLVDPAALEEAAKWLEVHSSSSGSAEAFAAEALREAIAQPAEAEGVSSARLMNTLAELARRAPLRTLHTICETQRQVSTVKLERHLEPVGDTLADYAFTLRIYFDKLSATLSAVTAERDRLREEMAELWKRIDKFQSQSHGITALAEIERLRAEVERLRDAAGKAIAWLDAEQNESGVGISRRLKLCRDAENSLRSAMAAKEAEPEHVCSGCGAKGWTGNCLECIPY